MNNRERRKASKELGILAHQSKLPRNKKFELMRENIIQGKKKEEEIRNLTKQHLDEQIAEKESNVMHNLAEYIAKTRKISYIDAFSEAEKMYKNSKIKK